MKRLLFSPGFPPNVGGQPSYMYARALAAPQDLEVIALRWDGSDAFDAYQPFVIHRFAYLYRSVPRSLDPLKRVIQLLQAVSILWKYLHKGDFSVLEVGTVFPGAIIAELLFPKRRFHLVAYALGDDILRPQKGRLSRSIFLWTIRRIDLFVAISGYTRQLLINAGVSANRIVLIPPPIDQEHFRRHGDPSNIREKLPPHDFVLLTVCKLSEKKNIGAVIELMPGLLKKFPGLLYVVAGDGPDRARLESLAQTLNVQDHVVFLGYVPSDRIVDLYAAADVFVMVTKEDLEKSTVEGYGIVFLEAGSQGVPVIGPVRGGSGDAIVDGVTGYLVDSSDPYELEDRIITLLSNPALRQQFGRAGKEKAFGITDWSPLLGFGGQ